MGTACYVRGGKQVLESCRQELGIDVGGTTSDGLFTLEVARCFGACGLAPTIMIDEDVHQRVKPPRLRELFAAYRTDVPGGFRADVPPTARKTMKKTKKTVTKKPLKKATAGRTGTGRTERVGAR